jgi:ribose transport system substrate-binding protein
MVAGTTIAGQHTPAPPGPASKEHAVKEIVVGFAQDTFGNDWRLEQVRELERNFAHHPHIRLITTNGGGNTAKQIRDIEDLIHQNVDILITSPRDSVAMTPAIARAYKSGIPVVLLTRGIVSNDYTTLIGPDDATIATDAARFIAKHLNGDGNVLVLKGLPTATTAIARTDAFVKEIQKYPGINIAAIKVGNYLRSDAIHAVEEALQAGVKFNAIYAQSDSMAAGARMVLKRAGLNPSDYLIVGIDYINEAHEAIRSGEQAASFTYPTSGATAVAAILDITSGKKVPKRIIVDSTCVTSENVEDIKPIF